MKTVSNMLLAALALAASSTGSLMAADEVPQYEGIPSYSVTRLKIFEGTVWVRTPDSGEWEEFRNNSPLPEQARVSVPDDSEAELQFHGGQFMLLTGGTELDLRRQEKDLTEFHLRAGEIRFDLPEEDFSPVRVLVPTGDRVDFPVPGKYWVIAPEDGDPRLVVRAGEATVTTDRGGSTVRRGEEARIGRDVQVGPYAGGPEEKGVEEPVLSDEEREAGVPPAAATELREYGEWVYSSEYGYVWRPRVAPGWSPYYYGQWSWISPYGWTWISYEPWGWYPYHYGYWYTDPVFGWVWYPFRSFVSVSFVFGNYRYPHYHRRAYFVPATVRFVGYGSGVRWVPLRPGERIRRVRFTRSDRRLVRWERTLPARTVFVRRRGDKGSTWADWSSIRQERRRTVTPRTRERRNMVMDRKPSREREVREERTPRERPAGVRERSDTRRRGTVSTIRKEREPRDVREERREKSVRSGPGIPPADRERPKLPPARRMERSEPRSPGSMRPAVRQIPRAARQGNGRIRPEPTVSGPGRTVREMRPSNRPESFPVEGRGRTVRESRPSNRPESFPVEGQGRGGRSDYGDGGWNRGGGVRRVR